MTFVFPLARRAFALCMIAAVSAVFSPAFAQVDEQHVIVGYKKGKSAKFRAPGFAPQRHARIKHDLARIGALAMVLSGAELKKLRQDRDVDYIEEDVPRYPLAVTRMSTGEAGTPYLAGQQVPYGLKLVQADQLPDTNAANRKLCIIDSGYDRSHEDLPSGSNITGDYDAGTGWWYTDERRHGTHVAGTILALNNQATGVVGVAPNNRLKVHIVKVFDADGWAYSSTLSAAAEKCAAVGANVISMSIGGARYSKTEEATFAALAARGILSVSAAGNAGNRNLSYPGAYDSVLMVGAINEFLQHSSYSQYNSKVELVAPGDQVYSTVPMGEGMVSDVSLAGETLLPGTLAGSPMRAVSAPLADFGLGDKVTSTMTGKLCLIVRGSISFAEKVLNCQLSGGVGAVVYNNSFGIYNGTLGDTMTAIPSATVSDYDGTRLRARLGANVALSVKPMNYKYIDGTSMAVPHVSGVAALVWSYFPACSGSQIRTALSASARDLTGTGVRSDRTGNGLVQARAAYDYLLQKGCTGPA
jgi:subtilisin family serine protease